MNNQDSAVVKVTEDALDQIEQLADVAGQRVEAAASPFRSRVLKRFPVLFLLLVTFGVSATFAGMERLFLNLPFFVEHPGFLFVTGLLVLVATGTLYKKLG